ncbi:MAG: flavin reductase family protein [Streptosporangiaceae bacterium]|nr:flavin reductase family protein [Streptosporangiaceae bacterium]
MSVDPPLVLISLMAESYLSELFLPRGDDPPAAEGIPGRAFAVTMLGAGQRMVAGRFAAEGRPSARLMLDDVPHHRGPISGALIPGEGLAAIECITEQRVPAGDHLLIVARVIAVAYVSDAGSPLIRFQGRYLLST